MKVFEFVNHQTGKVDEIPDRMLDQTLTLILYVVARRK